jgi:hypothetical protein
VSAAISRTSWGRWINERESKVEMRE